MHTPPSWQQPYLGLKEFPRGLTEYEVRAFFYFDEGERAAIQSRRGSDLRLAAALHLGFIKMTGATLDAVDRVPLPVLGTVTRSLNIPQVELVTLRALYRRRQRTLFEHQRWAMNVLRMRPFTDHRQRVVVRLFRDRARQTIVLPELSLSIKKWLYEHRILIPAERRIKELAGRLVREAEQQLAEEVNEAIPLGYRKLWWAELYEPTSDCATRLEWLQRAPSRRSYTTIEDAFD